MVSQSILKSESVSSEKLKKRTAIGASKHSTTNKDNCIYIRYRRRKLPTRDEVRLLHPYIIDVRFPRQKNAKFCHLEFENKESAISACKQLKKTHKTELAIINYLGKSHSSLASNIDSGDEESEDETSNSEEKVEQSTPKEDIQPCACLHVSGLPDFVVKEVIQSLYPSNIKIEIGDKKSKGKRYAIVHFESTEEATRVMNASESVCVNGNILTVKFHK